MPQIRLSLPMVAIDLLDKLASERMFSRSNLIILALNELKHAPPAVKNPSRPAKIAPEPVKNVILRQGTLASLVRRTKYIAIIDNKHPDYWYPCEEYMAEPYCGTPPVSEVDLLSWNAMAFDMWAETFMADIGHPLA